MTESQTNQDFPSKPTTKTTNEKSFYVRTGLHTELQKLGKRPMEREEIFDVLKEYQEREDIEIENVEIVGIENTKVQNKALFAIQKLLENTDYKGNSFSKEFFNEDDYKTHEMVKLPVLRITPAQYLKAYGVKKYKTSRGKKEFGGRERARAFEALYDLRDKRCLFYYKRKHWNKKKGKLEEPYDQICTIQSIIRIREIYEDLTGKVYEDLMEEDYEDLTRKERDKVKSWLYKKENNSKPKYLEIIPRYILIDQIDTYYVLKPANCYQEIELVFPRASKFVYRFIDYLFTQASIKSIKSREKTGWTIEINYLKLAYKLRMNNYINSRQKNRIKKVLERCYKIAKKLNYLLSYETVPGVKEEKEVIKLNPEKFTNMKSTDRKNNKKRGK